jgi:hypothetical protein
VSFALAILLFLAAAMKVVGARSVVTFPQSGAVSETLFIIGSAYLEFVLGTLLFLQIRRRSMWVLTTAVFSLFFFISVSKAAVGTESCGCFGNVRIQPAFTAALDLLALFSLCWCRKDAFSNSQRGLLPKT